MLVEFRVANFRSFKDEVVLSRVASPDSERAETLLPIPGDPSLKLLPIAAIFGGNASGKSNLIRALAFMRTYVLQSTRERLTPQERAREPFRLDATAAAQPSQFEVTVVVGDSRHRYGFALDEQGVADEWLFVRKKRETRMFERTRGEPVKCGDTWRGERERMVARTRGDALLLTVASEAGQGEAAGLVGWMHPLLVLRFVALTLEAIGRRRSGQLLFTTHTSEVFGPKIRSGDVALRRDELWLTEKKNNARSELFALWQVKGVRKTEDMRTRYLRGSYGGVPRLVPVPGLAVP